MTPEGKVKAAIDKWLKKRGWWYCKPATGGYGKSGVLDYIVCRPRLVLEIDVGTKMGEFITIEAKRKGGLNDATQLQLDTIDDVQAVGGIAFVCDDVSQLDKRFKDQP